MAWLTHFFILLPLFIIFVIFANDHEFAEVPESKTNDMKSQEIEARNVLVEVTDAIEGEEEEEEALVYTPSIAPATPQVLTSSSKYIQHDVAALSDGIKTDGKQVAVTNESESNLSGGIVANKVAEENQSIYTSPMTIAPSSSYQSPIDATLSTSLPSMFSESSPFKKEDSPTKEDVDGHLYTNENTNKQSEHNDINQHILPSAEKGHEEKYEDATAITNDSSLKHVNINMSTGNENETKSLPIGSADELGSMNLTREQNKAENQKKDQDELIKKEVDGKGGLNDDAKKKQLEIEPGPREKNVPKSHIKGETLYDEKTEVRVVEIKGVQEQKSDSQQDGPVIISIVKPDEDGEKTEVEKKMLSFAEWKKEKEEDTINQSKVHEPKNKTILKKKNKIKKNFASIDCGGKVIAANEEASNILSVLKEDKDIYMLNPCNVKAWFVVELCDRIQVDSIDLANFEMFSSTPEIFNVYVTSRYPSGSWEKVDTFHAKPEKQVQTFVFADVFYAKYIKIEIKKYFGNEHYCPLSLLRVFGITEVEQFEDSDELDNSHEDGNHDDAEHVPDEYNSDLNAANIFEAAKNVVAGLVNGMAIKLSGKSNLETNDSSLSVNSAVVTITALSNENAIEGVNSTRYYKDSLMVGENSVTWEMWYYYRYPKQTCPITDPKRFIKEIKATVFFGENSTFISPNQFQISSSMLSDNLHATIVATPDTMFVSKTTSGSNINTSVFKAEVTPTAVQKTTPNVERSITKTSVATALLNGIPIESSSVKLNTGSITTTKSDVETNNFLNLTSIVKPVEKTIDDEESADVLHFKVNETVNGAVIAEKIIPNISNSDVTSQNVTNVNLTSLNDQKTVVSDSINGSHIDHQQKSTDSEHNDTKSLEEEFNVPSTTQSLTEMEKLESAKLLPDIVKSNDTATEKSSNSHMKLNDKKTDHIPEYSVEKDIQTSNTKTTSGSKESIIAKLNAKVKGLEANLTMSMMYLDEMSERYQTAVEKVDERHKKKSFALNVSFNYQQEMIKNQSLLITNLTNQIHDIVFQIQNLTRTTQEQHQKMIETHATWVFLEIIFILVFLLLCRHNPKSYNNNKDNELVHHRRFSEPVIVKNKKVNVVERQLSDPTTGCSVESSNTNSQLQQNAFLTKKRKRKKNSKIISELEGNTNVQNISVVPEKVGPAFGCNWMYGIAGAFKRKDSGEKMSRQADALIDKVSIRSFDGLHLRKVKSSELPVIHEDIERDIIERPKSCNDLEYYRKCS